jgi:tetratricopeptide (TPR) repeat protein
MLRTGRMATGLTQEELAELSGLSVRAISDIERGVTVRPRRSTVALLEAALGRIGPAAGAADGPPAQGSPDPRGTAPSRPRQLPATVPGFTGRARELIALTEVLNRKNGGCAATAVIAGMAGVGKTALAVHWANRVAKRFPDGQLYVNMRGYDPGQPVPAADALAAMLRALGMPGRDIPPGQDERAALYRSLLAGRRILVVLDNAASAEQVRPLLPGAGGCAAAVTSRDALAGLVARDGATRLELGVLPLDDSISLLRALIGSPVDDDPAALGTLAERCARLPLALRIAAELAVAHPSVPLAALSGDLARQQRRLDLLGAGGDPRTAVRSVFSWSIRHLDPDAVRAFRLLGLNPCRDFDQYAVAALAGATLTQADLAVGTLVRAHLIQRAGPYRWSLHDLLRNYACDLAAEHDSEEQRRAALSRLIDHYLHTAAAAMDALYPGERHRRPRVPVPAGLARSLADPVSARAWLDSEHTNLAAIAAYAADHGWARDAICLATTVFRHLEAGGLYPEIVSVCTHARRAARQVGDLGAEAEALRDMAIADVSQGHYRRAYDRVRVAHRLFLAVGDHTGEARAVVNLGVIAFHRGRMRLADRHYGQALGLYRSTGDRFGEARALNNIGFVALHLGRYQQAVDRLSEAEALSRQTCDHAITIYAQVNLAMVHLRQGRVAEARGCLTDALALSRETGNPVGIAYSLAHLGLAHLRQGDGRQADIDLSMALDLSRGLGDRVAEAAALNGLGEVARAAGRIGRAQAQHGAALRIGDKYEQARAYHGLAHSYDAAGEGERARQCREQALVLFTAMGTPETEGVRAELATMNGASRPRPRQRPRARGSPVGGPSPRA